MPDAIRSDLRDSIYEEIVALNYTKSLRSSADPRLFSGLNQKAAFSTAPLLGES